MAVVKSLKNAKHKKLWTKKFAGTLRKTLLITKNLPKMSLSKPLTWRNSRKLTKTLVNSSNTYSPNSIIVINLLYYRARVECLHVLFYI